MVTSSKKLSASQNVPSKKRKFIFIPLLIFLAISSLALSVLSVKKLHWEDRIPIQTGLMLFFYGLIFFTASFITSNQMFFHTNCGRALMKKYGFSKEVILEINNKNISTIQATFCSITGLTSVCYSCTRDMLHTSHYISEAYAWFGAAYFLYDIWSMYVVQCAEVKDDRNGEMMNGNSENGRKSPSDSREDNDKNQRSVLSKFLNFVRENPVIVGHHVFVGGFGFLVITYLRGGLGDCFFGFVFLMEVSTPFVSLRSILSKIGLKNSRYYVINGLCMMISFFLFRVMMWPYVMWMYSYSVNMSYFEAISSLPRGCKISILILMLPQLYWFGLIVKGATQINKRKNKKKKIT